MSNQYITDWKLKPGSEPARAVELLRFLPAGTKLGTHELRKRIDAQRENFEQSLRPVVSRGLVRRERRRNPNGPGNAIFWRAGEGAPHHGTDSTT